MIFQSFEYIAFLIAFLLVYWRLPHRWQCLWTLLASYFFYGFATPWFLLLLVGSTLVDFQLARLIERRATRRKQLLWLSIVTNLLLLATFKYSTFLTENLNVLATTLGLGSVHVLRWVLPAGISFYTFQSISYVVDVYRGERKACQNLVDYAGFIAFFPQLVAGPIERSSSLLTQLERPRRLSLRQVTDGWLLVAWGFFQKLVVADNAATIADQIFTLQNVDFWILWTGVLAFGIQIYADFSAYSDIARGTAKLLGIELSRNFLHPYFSASPREFWRRWHVTLGAWFKDYVFRPFVGKNAGRERVAAGYAIVFLLSGIWHGASWNFLWWGAFHGAVLVASLYVGPRIPARFLEAPATRPLRVLLTFGVVTFGWLLFRERSIVQIGRYLSLNPFATPVVPPSATCYALTLLALYATPLVLAALVERQFVRSTDAQLPYGRWSHAIRFGAAVGLTALVCFGASAVSSDFIYFQF